MLPYEDAIRRGGGGVAVEGEEAGRFKVVINLHGNGNEWSNRFRSLLSSGAVVLKQASTLYEFWESELAPFVHYVPVKADLSDLVEMTEWVLDNDSEAQRIAQRAHEFVRDRLSMNRVHCYWAHLISRYRFARS
jgi:hypothetical protein